MNNENKSMVVQGIISNTTNKQGKDFETEHPRKTLSVIVDEENKKKLESFGLQEYTSKETGENFFLIKASGKVIVEDFLGNITEFDGSAGANCGPNFKSDGEVFMNLFKSKNKGNEFVRVTDILGSVEVIERQDPFAEARKNLPKI